MARLRMLTTPPGAVRVALVADLGLGAVFGLSALLGLPGGPLGRAVVGVQAAAWSALVAHWVFPAFWSRWTAAVEGLFVRDHDVTPVALRTWPARRGVLAAAALVGTGALVQAAWGSAPGPAYRAVVNAFVLSGGVVTATLAVVHDVRRMLAATSK